MWQEVTILPTKTINSTPTAAEETQRVVTDQQGATLFSEGTKRPINHRGVSQWTQAHINGQFRCAQTYKSFSVRPHPDEDGANVTIRSEVLSIKMNLFMQNMYEG